MTRDWPRACLGVLGIVLLCGCPQSSAPSTGSAVRAVPNDTGKALATFHVPGMTERLELF